MTFPFPNYDEMDFYEWNSNTEITKVVHTGDTRDFTTRDINSSYFSFEINLKPGEIKYFAIKIKSEGRINICFCLESLES